jgi:acetylornithine deacetylase
LTEDALGRLDADAIAHEAAGLVRVPSVTGDERRVLEHLAERAQALGLRATLVAHDLGDVRAAPGWPGEEAPREELLHLEVVLPGRDPAAPRLAIAAHVDVVPAGSGAWTHEPFSGAVADGCVWGRGSVDMKGAAAAALHALAAVAAAGGGRAPRGDVVLLAVSSEEDGGQGAFAALRGDDRYGACVIPEATGFDVVCAQAGSITFEGTVSGVAAHAAERLHGASAIDRYLPVHAALADLERDLNAAVEHALMRALELPYPLVVGRLAAGDWPSTVPDRLVFEGRAPVRVGESVAQARAAVEAAVAAAGAGSVELRWTGGTFASAETPADHPLVELAAAAVTAERGSPALAGVPWGADFRLFCERGIPTVMVGTPGIELAHAVDERVAVADLHALARILVRVIERF